MDLVLTLEPINGTGEKMSVAKNKNNIIENKVDYVLAQYCEYVKENQMLPTGNDLKDELGLTKKAVEHHFGNYERLMKAAKASNPKAFAGIFMPEDFTGETFESVRKEIRKYNRFVITTAVCGAKVNKPFLASLKNYCKRRKAKLLVLPTGKDLIRLDPTLKGEAIITNEIFLNSNIKILPVLLNPKTLRPTSGMSRHGQRSCSTIYAAPKITKESIATDTGKYPHLVVTTGAVTNPAYSDAKQIMKKKADYVAENDHDLACLIVEIVDGIHFHQREMQADIDGSIVDLTMNGPIRYFPSGKVKGEVCLNMNVPDWHHGETAEDCYQQWPRLAKLSKSLTVSLHDVLSILGHTHHTAHDKIKSAQIEESGMSDPVVEIQGFADDLKMWMKACAAKFYIVGSNHPEHLNRGIAEGTLDENSTRRTYLELALAMLDGNDPLQWGLKKYAQFQNSRINFLSRESRHVLKNKFGEMALHFHGDKGNDGAKNSGQSQGIAISAGCAVINHLHSPKIIAGNTLGGEGNGGVWVGGTSTCVDGDERPGYARGGGGSSWLKTATFVYGSKNGRFLRQQITLVAGQWCLDSGAPKVTKDIRAKRHQQFAAEMRKRRQRGLDKIN
jgi:hypothetical protein